MDTRRFMQEEVDTLKRALAAAQGGGNGQGLAGAAGAGDGEGGGLFGEGVAGLRERLARAERENRALKKQLEGALLACLLAGWMDGRTQSWGGVSALEEKVGMVAQTQTLTHVIQRTWRMTVGGWPQGGEEEGDVLLLQSRLEELERLKGEREKEAIESKKKAAALEAGACYAVWYACMSHAPFFQRF